MRVVDESGAETVWSSPGSEAWTCSPGLEAEIAFGSVTGHNRAALALVLSWACGHNALEWTVWLAVCVAGALSELRSSACVCLGKW